MVMGEVIEGLNIWVGEGVEANAVVGSAVEVLEDVQGRFVVLIARIGAV